MILEFTTQHLALMYELAGLFAGLGVVIFVGAVLLARSESISLEEAIYFAMVTALTQQRLRASALRLWFSDQWQQQQAEPPVDTATSAEALGRLLAALCEMPAGMVVGVPGSVVGDSGMLVLDGGSAGWSTLSSLRLLRAKTPPTTIANTAKPPAAPVATWRLRRDR